MPVTFKNKNLMLGYFIDSIQRNTFKRRRSLGHDHFQWHVDATVLNLPSAKRQAAMSKRTPSPASNAMDETANSPHTPSCHPCLGFAQTLPKPKACQIQ
jgi:hypothetical protein